MRKSFLFLSKNVILNLELEELDCLPGIKIVLSTKKKLSNEDVPGAELNFRLTLNYIWYY
jgi:hypothetical protein